MTAAAFRSAITQTFHYPGTSGPYPYFSLPPGTSAGDYLVVAVGCSVASNILGGVFGGSTTFTQLAISKIGTPAVEVFGAFLAAGDITNGIITIMVTSSHVNVQVIAAAYSGASGLQSFTASIIPGSGNCALTPTPTASDNTLIIGVAALNNNTAIGVFAYPTGYVPRTSYDDFSFSVTALAIADLTLGTSTAYTMTAADNITYSTPGAAGDAIGVIIALNPTPLQVTAQGSTLTVDLNLAANPAPVGLNSSWPQIITEVAFGQNPNDNTTQPFWTDISDRLLAAQLSRGQNFELAQPQTGNGTLTLRNNDGALNPTNTTSPWWPNIQPMRHARITTIWQGVSYPLWAGNIRTWPQDWDTTRFGLSQAGTIDLLGTLNGAMLPVIAAAMLASNPIHLWPFTESLQAPVTGGPDQTWNFTDEGSSPLTVSLPYTASSVATGNPFAATCPAALPLWAFTGSGFLPADSSEGVQIVSKNNTPIFITGTAADGISMLPLAGQIVTWEMWVYVKASSTISELLNITGAGFSLVVSVNAATSTFTINVINTAGNVTISDTIGFTIGAAEYVTVTLDATHPALVISYTIDTLPGVVTACAFNPPSLPVQTVNLAGQFSAGTMQMIACAMHQRYLGTEEIYAHLTAYIGDAYLDPTTGARVAKILQWGGWNGPAAIDTGLSIMQTAGGLGGSTISSALQQCVDTEVATLYVANNGALTFADRSRLANTTPTAVFGDGTGEIPYQGDIEFNLDPTYTYDRVSVTRNNGGTTVIRTPATAAAYFPNTLSRTVYSSADSDAQSQAAYLASAYATPALRVSTVTVDVIAVCHADRLNSTTLAATLLGLDIGAVVTVTRRSTTTVTGNFRIQQISPSISPSGFTLAFQLSPLLPAPTW